MKNELLQPVIFNVITIVALLFSLFQIVTGTSGRLIRTADAIHALEELAADGVLEDDSIVSGLSTNRDQRTRLDNYLIVTMIIAISPMSSPTTLAGAGAGITPIPPGFANLRQNCAGCERISSSGSVGRLLACRSGHNLIASSRPGHPPWRNRNRRTCLSFGSSHQRAAWPPHR